MKCGSLKGGMRGSELSTRGFIPWFGLPQRRPYVHVVEALTKSIASWQSSLFREPLRRHDTPSHAPRRCRSARSPSTRQGQIDRPQSLHSSPRSSLAYKDPQNPTVAPLLPLLPPPAAPPWPPRSRSRGPASPAPHCPLRPPQKLLHLPVKLHACGIEPKPPPEAVPLLRRRRRAQAHRGLASSGEDRARQLPQKHPRAHAVLVRALFHYPEPS